MFQGDKGIVPQHPRSCITHDRPDPLTFFGGVAVDDAPGTEVLPFPEGTAVQTFVAIVQKFTAVLTESRSAMMAAAVDEDHLLDDLLLILNPGHPAIRVGKRIQLVSQVHQISSAPFKNQMTYKKEWIEGFQG